MNLYSSSLVTNILSQKQRNSVQFTLQLFYANTLDFQESHSLLVSTIAGFGEVIDIKINLLKSPQYLRIDPGFLFSLHKNPNFEIIRIQEIEAVEKINCNPEDNSIERHQIHIELKNKETWMVCGYDPYFVFQNPFIGDDICIKFSSQLVLAIL
ncbi:MAG: hypothetical protein HWQ35_06515 [Nostoc sp. NMS1]|uniref:hypothetical protein n=1 Tax=unclassified Nostoc TaxID=2593658 RepID=UPI0025D8D222|nr:MULTISPECIES: hypothetical protein [unclassified Nostoc]MBN3906213.1 hypothetical protein [Nostoc sp. NMS1]MBN3992495.1 hypothetical protein [Nostoc sp. NMS2]